MRTGNPVRILFGFARMIPPLRCCGLSDIQNQPQPMEQIPRQRHSRSLGTRNALMPPDCIRNAEDLEGPFFLETAPSVYAYLLYHQL